MKMIALMAVMAIVTYIIRALPIMAFFDKGLMAAAVTSVVIAFVSGFFV